jgi:hypothetical protein
VQDKCKTTSLVSMVPACNNVSSSSRVCSMVKVTEHAGQIPIFL